MQQGTWVVSWTLVYTRQARKDAISRRINIQHRLVYEVLEDIKTVKVTRMWTHYE